MLFLEVQINRATTKILPSFASFFFGQKLLPGGHSSSSFLSLAFLFVYLFLLSLFLVSFFSNCSSLAGACCCVLPYSFLLLFLPLSTPTCCWFASFFSFYSRCRYAWRREERRREAGFHFLPLLCLRE